MAMGWRSPFQFWNKRDIAIDGEIVEYCAREFVPRPIGVRSSGGDLLGLLTGEIRGAGIEECANGACRRKKFDVAKQRQLRNGGSSTQALEWGVEANLDSQCRLRTDVLNGDEQHAVFEIGRASCREKERMVGVVWRVWRRDEGGVV